MAAVTEWYQQGYPGAPPPGGLIPLARPLYPPDATAYGKKPSTDGPDCEAIRRGISRGGRAPWEWATGQNKRKWSNTFAHGSPGWPVGETGAAGFQRQQGIDDTGWWGTASHNALQYALVPTGVGLPHAGEHLLDDVARDLLREAVTMFKGDTSTVRKAALAEAKTWIGYTESPPGTNNSSFGIWYGLPYQPWCAMAVSYWFELGNTAGSPSFQQGERYHYCPTIVDDARAGRHGLTVTSSPVAGDLCVYDWDGGGFDHVGLYEQGTSFSWSAIEGNTSVGNDSNGGAVMRRERAFNEAFEVVFVRVAEP